MARMVNNMIMIVLVERRIMANQTKIKDIENEGPQIIRKKISLTQTIEMWKYSSIIGE